MAQLHENRKLEMKLVALVARQFPGMTVKVENSERWGRMCVTFRWPGFADLLPEERFQRLVGVIPEKFRKSRLEGFVWLELTPSETVEEFLKLPRSDDAVNQEASVYARLCQAGFFEALSESLGETPTATCPGDFSHTAKVLARARYSPQRIVEVKLVFIAHGAYCDCQVLDSVEPVLAQRHMGAA